MKNQLVVVVGIMALLAGLSIGAGLLQTAPTVGSVRVWDDFGNAQYPIQLKYIQIPFTPDRDAEPTGFTVRLGLASGEQARIVPFNWQIDCPPSTDGSGNIGAGGHPGIYLMPNQYIAFTLTDGFTIDNPDFKKGDTGCAVTITSSQFFWITRVVQSDPYHAQLIVWGEPPSAPGTPGNIPQSPGLPSEPVSEAVDEEPCPPGLTRSGDACVPVVTDIMTPFLWALVAILILFGIAVLFIAVWR